MRLLDLFVPFSVVLHFISEILICLIIGYLLSFANKKNHKLGSLSTSMKFRKEHVDSCSAPLVEKRGGGEDEERQ